MEATFCSTQKPILRRVVFTLLSEASLIREIAQLKANLKILTDVSGERLNAIRGLGTNAANIRAEELATVANLYGLARRFLKSCSSLAQL